MIGSPPLNEVDLAEVTDLIQYGYTAKSGSHVNGPKYLRITDIQNDNVDWKSVPQVSIPSDDYQRYRLMPGDIVFARSGATVGKSFLIQDDPGKAVFASYLIRVRCSPERLDPQYAAYFFRSSEYWKQIREGATGTGQPNFNGTKLGGLRLPIRPLKEQRRIAEKLESLLVRSKKSRAELARVPQLIKRYRDAVLRAAFEGQLTAEWRSSPRAQPAEDPIEHLRSIRAAKCKSIGLREKAPCKPSWIPQIDIPRGWHWVSVDELATLVQYGTSAKTTETADVPVLRMGNISSGQLDYTSLKYLPGSHPEFPDLLLADGDILFNRTNSAELVGKTAVYRDHGRPTSFASYLIRVQVVGYLPDLLSAYINSEYGRAWVSTVVSQQVGQANVNGTKLRELGVPMMPVAEQEQIWLRINECFTRVDRVLTEVQRAGQLLDRLDSSILERAFRGDLLAP